MSPRSHGIATTGRNSELRLFADDCVCYREIKNSEDTVKLQEVKDRLGCWARSWGIKFQPVKCRLQGNGSRRSMLLIPYRKRSSIMLKR